MKLIACLWIPQCLILLGVVDFSQSSHWAKFITSKHYVNTRLLTEMSNPFQLYTVSKENPLTSTRLFCSQFCANNASCWGFNFYDTDTDHVCEFLAENFCFKRKRVVLQFWPGGNVWDKLSPGMTQACVDQKLATASTTQYCGVVRPGCDNNTTSSITGLTTTCSSCPRTCVDCARINPSTAAYYECTLWPEGPSGSPIFVLCYGSAVYVILRKVDPSSGMVGMDYRLTPIEMHRISRLNVYKTFYLGYISTVSVYLAYYTNFYIDADGSLMNMTFIGGGGGDGFNTGNTPLKPSPWVENNSSCGSFWFLNSTLASATMQCPGGGVGMLGTVNINVFPKETGIHWPKATTFGEIFVHGDIKLML